MGKVASLRPRHRFAYCDRPPSPNPVDVYLSRFQSSGSVITMRHSLEVCAKSLSEGAMVAHSLDWTLVEYPDLLGLRQKLAQQYKSATANKHLQAAKGVLKECWRLGRLTIEEYHRRIDLPAVRGASVPPGRQLEGDELRRLFAVCWAERTPANVRMLAMLAIFVSTGCRRAELIALRLEDYDAETGRVLIQGKGNKERLGWVVIAAAKAYLADWIALRGDASGPMFVGFDRYGKALSPLRALGYHTLKFLFEQLGERAGVPHYTIHDFRRTAISNWWDANVDGVTIQRIAGHADIRTTAKYDRRPERAQIAAAMTVKMPSRDE